MLGGRRIRIRCNTAWGVVFDVFEIKQRKKAIHMQKRDRELNIKQVSSEVPDVKRLDWVA